MRFGQCFLALHIRTDAIYFFEYALDSDAIGGPVRGHPADRRQQRGPEHDEHHDIYFGIRRKRYVISQPTFDLAKL